MNEVINHQFQEFDTYSEQELAQTTLLLGKYAMSMAGVHRVPRYATGERENNAEHSYMLSLVAPALAAQIYPDLDGGLIAQFANVHDLVETVTGDIATFNASEDVLATKAKQEEQAVTVLQEQLDPYTAGLLTRYELQKEVEARLVRMVDKLLPLVVDIYGQGERVLREDYSVRNPSDVIEAHHKLFERFSNMFPDFPELLAVYRVLCSQFEAQFTAVHYIQTTKQYAPMADQPYRNARRPQFGDKWAAVSLVAQ